MSCASVPLDVDSICSLDFVRPFGKKKERGSEEEEDEEDEEEELEGDGRMSDSDFFFAELLLIQKGEKEEDDEADVEEEGGDKGPFVITSCLAKTSSCVSELFSLFNFFEGRKSSSS